MKQVGLLVVCVVFCKTAIAQNIVLLGNTFSDNSAFSYRFDDEIHESSGLAISKKNPGIFWTHNDSQSEAIIYGIDIEVGIVAKLTLKDVINYDFEDIALASCSKENLEEQCLFVADIGTNVLSRTYTKIHLIKEPDLLHLPKILKEDLEPLATVKLIYEDNKIYNAESLAITEDLDFLIITKGDDTANAMLFRLPYEVWHNNYADGPLTLEYEFTLFDNIDTRFGQVTAASYQDGILSVKTYSHVHFFNKPKSKGQGWLQNRKPCFILHLAVIGEGLEFDQNRVYISSENLLARHIGLGNSNVLIQRGGIFSFICQPVR